MKGVAAQVVTKKGTGGDKFSSVFVENGGTFCYEALPYAYDGGLLEGATPECRGPSQLLLYQKAQEHLLKNALGPAKKQLRSLGVEEVSLIKNCRDAGGHVYGAQENYEVELCDGAWLWVYRLGLLLFAPVSLVFVTLVWIAIVALLTVLLPVFIVMGVVAAFRPGVERMFDAFVEHRMESLLLRATLPLQWLVVLVGTFPIVLLRITAFRRIRQSSIAFLASRIAFTGAGSLEKDGSFVLAEKVSGMRRVERSWATFQGAAILDTGHFISRFVSTTGWYRDYRSLFSKRQRLQIGLSDSNRAEIAEYLRFGTTCLVLDMIEAEFLSDAPRLKSPIAALRAINADPTLRVKVELGDGCKATACDLQRWYLERAEAFVTRSEVTSLEAREVIRLWREALDALEEDPDRLVGRVDWVTKRWLLAASGAEASQASRKKTDLKYHELGSGYFDQLEAVGDVPRLVHDEEIERAMREPPERSPARMRSRLLKELASDESAVFDWTIVRVGRRVGGKVIRIDEYRDP